jgi:hypothetical protein
MSVLAPIVLFVYNRPEHTRRTLAALAANPLAGDSDLIIYADGPKKPEHAASVQQARDVARGASGFRFVRLVERNENLGLARSIITGVSEVCSEHGRAIVVEDDLVVSPDFLGFLNAGLDHYADERDVMQVSAYAYPTPDGVRTRSYFLPMASCWGWATWERAWSRFDPAMAFLRRLDQDRALQHRFNVDGAYDYYGMACQQRKGQIDSWGIRWQLTMFESGGLVLYPKETLVTNIGVDDSGTHGAGEPAYQVNLPKHRLAISDLSWPTNVIVDEQAFAQVKQLLRGTRPTFLRRALHLIGSWR